MVGTSRVHIKAPGNIDEAIGTLNLEEEEDEMVPNEDEEEEQ